MNPNQSAAFKNLEQAQQALKSGDRNAARQFAAQAAQLAPELEEVWLMMGALASTRASVSYLEQAARINPQSERAQKGLQWARARLQKEIDAEAQATPTVAAIESAPPAPVLSAIQEPRTDPNRRATTVAASEPGQTQPRKIAAPVAEPAEPEPAAATRPVVIPKTIQNNKASGPRSPYLVLLIVLLLCLVASWAVWQFATPMAAFLTSSAFRGAEHGPSWAQVSTVNTDASQTSPDVTAVPANAAEGLATQTSVAGSASTEAASATSTPGDTSLATPTQTLPSPSATMPAPSATLAAPAAAQTSSTPQVADQPGSTPGASATQEVAALEEPSPTPLPTDTAAPLPAQVARATPQPGVSDAGGSGRWIDVDLTNQMVYAFEGNTVVNSFLVSTGTWQHPTVTGQYHVYIKYRYKDMSGPGYYLPNVPYTMFFYQGYAIHGTYWHSNFGTPMSHGCVNLSIPDSEWVYNWASVGTLVNVHY